MNGTSRTSFVSIGPRCAHCCLLTVITGVIYPLAVWAIAMLPGLHAKAEGSIIDASGKPAGSKLIGQSFTDKDGNPLPRYFQTGPRWPGPATTRWRREPPTWARKHRRHAH